MERLIHSLRILWRTDRLLTQNEIRLLSKKLQFNALAGLVALFGLVMLSLAVFFALVPHWGHSLAALAVGGTDILLAALLVGYAGSLKPAPEVEMIKEMRDLALNDIKEEVALADAENAWVLERQNLGLALAQLEAVLGRSLQDIAT